LKLMSLTPELMRSFILEALKLRPPEQYMSLKIATAGVAGRRGYPVEQQPHGYPPTLLHEDERRFREAVQALIQEGVLVPGKDENNNQWPFLSLTEYGEEVVMAGRVQPHDTEGYLEGLAEERPLDKVEERYLPQALEAFRRNLPDASAVMLGAVSEHLLLQLGEAIEGKDPASAAAVRRKLDGPALGLLTFLQDYFSSRRTALPRELRETLDTTFVGIASFIRVTRNDAGHPAIGRPVERDQAFVALQLFPGYRSWVLSVIKLLPI
jgi:hypothetical protein